MAFRWSRIPYDVIRHHIPENAWLLLLPLIEGQPLHIILWDHRQSKFGDYRSPDNHGIHRISVNKSQNHYSFLITLIHELAHMMVYERYGQNKQPHGREWKHVFRSMLMPFIQAGCFPPDLTRELHRHLENPKATTASDLSLSKMLSSYDSDGGVLLEDVPTDTVFRLENGMVFRKGEKRRSRYSCTRIQDDRLYYVNALARVEVV
ncbi:MAG: SprT-like domain-containing protein [Flavobacteriales bacterium]|nr:SprT-like domain-containing protein [Flavobacteriales bacterium]